MLQVNNYQELKNIKGLNFHYMYDLNEINGMWELFNNHQEEYENKYLDCQEIVSLDYKSYYCIIEMVEIDNEEIYPYIYVGDGNSNIEGEYYLIDDDSIFDNEKNLEVSMFNSIVEYINNN